RFSRPPRRPQSLPTRRSSDLKHPFLQVFPQYKQKLRWLPWSIKPEIMKDWGMEKDIDALLMGLVYVNGQTRGKFDLPRKIPTKEIGRAHVCTPVTFRSRMPSP